MTRRLLIATPLYPPEIGGPATYVKILEEELPKHGVSVRVEKFSDVRTLPRGVRHFAYWGNLLTALRRNDMILALDPVSVGFPAYLASRILMKPFYVKVVGDYAWEQKIIQNSKGKSKNEIQDFITPEEFQKNSYDFMTEVRRWIEHYVARKAQRVIVPSGYLRKIVMMWGVEPEKIDVVYNSFKEPERYESKEDVRKALKFNGPVIVSAGRLVPWKGFELLVGLMPALLREFSGLRLLIIGDGPERKRLVNLVAQLELANSVSIIDALPHRELLRHIRASDVFALNTSYEGLSHVLLEARSLCTPIVTTDVGGNPEVVREGKDGFLVSWNDREAFSLALRDVLSGRFKKMVDGDARGFSIEQMIGGLIRTFNKR